MYGWWRGPHEEKGGPQSYKEEDLLTWVFIHTCTSKSLDSLLELLNRVNWLFSHKSLKREIQTYLRGTMSATLGRNFQSTLRSTKEYSLPTHSTHKPTMHISRPSEKGTCNCDQSFIGPALAGETWRVE